MKCGFALQLPDEQATGSWCEHDVLHVYRNSDPPILWLLETLRHFTAPHVTSRVIRTVCLKIQGKQSVHYALHGHDMKVEGSVMFYIPLQQEQPTDVVSVESGSEHRSR